MLFELVYGLCSLVIVMQHLLCTTTRNEEEARLALTVLGVLILVTHLRLQRLLLLLTLGGHDGTGVNAGGREPEEVVGLEVVHLLEESVKAVDARLVTFVDKGATAQWKNLHVLLLLDLEDALVNLLVLERLQLVVVLCKVDRLLAKVVLRAAVVRVEHGALQQQAQAGRLGDGDARRAVALADALERRAAAHDERRHADHLADLVHHEALAVHLERHPLGVADLDRAHVDLERLDVPLH